MGWPPAHKGGEGARGQGIHGALEVKVVPIGWHITFRLGSSRVIAPDSRAQRAAARSVLGIAQPFELLAFRLSDTHGHMEVVGQRAAAAELTRRVLIGLSRTLSLGEPFDRPRLTPILDQRHLDRTFAYVLRQDAHHGFTHDPFHEASNLPDLLGARVCGAWTRAVVRRHLPRVDGAQLRRIAGVETLEPAAVDLAQLAAAAAAAVGHGSLIGLHRDVLAARAAAIHLAHPGARTVDIARHLGVERTTVFRLRQRPTDPETVRAVRRQLAWRATLGTHNADAGIIGRDRVA